MVLSNRSNQDVYRTKVEPALEEKKVQNQWDRVVAITGTNQGVKDRGIKLLNMKL